MLKIDSKLKRMVIFMTDAAILAASVKTTLLEISKQAAALGSGLQINAPGNKPSDSAQYLLLSAESNAKIAEECGKVQPTSTQVL